MSRRIHTQKVALSRSWISRLAAIGVVALSCYDPTASIGFPCSPEGECPKGQECIADECHPIGRADAALAIDAPAPSPDVMTDSSTLVDASVDAPALDAGSCDDADSTVATSDRTNDYTEGSTENACLLPAPADNLIGLIGADDWSNGLPCGGCIHVEGPEGSVTVMIIDKDADDSNGDIVLTATAFEMIAIPADQSVQVTWGYVDCPVGDDTISYYFNQTGQGYDIQVRSHRYRIATVQAHDGVGWGDALNRKNDGYFEYTDDSDSALLRVTDVHGHTVEDTLSLSDDTLFPTSSQFPLCE